MHHAIYIPGPRSIHGANIPAPSARHRQDTLASTIIYRTQDIAGQQGLNQPLPFKLLRRHTYCSPTEVLYMAVAADCSYVEHFQTVKRAKAAILSGWNEVSRVYETSFDLKLGIFHLAMPLSTCKSGVLSGMEWNRPCYGDYDLNQRLNDFGAWTTNTPYPSVLWHLRTRCPYDRKLAYAYTPKSCGNLNQILSNGKLATTAVAVSSITSESWKVIAHEIGHNFGAEHDCDTKTCSKTTSQCCACDACDCRGRFLMTAVATNYATQFSPCSKKQICRGIGRLAGCLGAPQQYKLVKGHICGNSIKEEGEECDCGGVDGCRGNDCCDPLNCKFKVNAKCDDSTDECCRSCLPKPRGEVCRNSTGSCDTPETCDGNTGVCPVDRFLPNGTPCKDKLFSASGQCTSRDFQCQQSIRLSQSPGSKACGGSSDRCRLICTGESTECSVYPINVADGTSCGHNLFCSRGTCQGKGAAIDKAMNYLIIIIITLGVTLCILTILLVLRKVFRKAPAQHPASFPDPPPIHPTSAETRKLPRRGGRSRPGLPDFSPPSAPANIKHTSHGLCRRPAFPLIHNQPPCRFKACLSASKSQHIF
ncbi:hypothetical protein DSO57_1032573 [Entomophthora muscae]|uniref:Uncharacterized protein n=1 Tax=Entomophthora muscae TaxID=34485 RepID=A0ACC2TM88_9FUNG|nr:hypothetical protein DSO57_1032573 [Entomophthora muscae]